MDFPFSYLNISWRYRKIPHWFSLKIVFRNLLLDDQRKNIKKARKMELFFKQMENLTIIEDIRLYHTNGYNNLMLIFIFLHYRGFHHSHFHQNQFYFIWTWNSNATFINRFQPSENKEKEETYFYEIFKKIGPQILILNLDTWQVLQKWGNIKNNEKDEIEVFENNR